MNVDGSQDGLGIYGTEDERHWGICPGCDGTGQAYAGRFSSHPGMCRECFGRGEVEVDE